MADELTIHPHDAIIRLTDDDIKLITDEVDKIVKEAKARGDIEYAFLFGDTLSAFQQKAWVATSHLIYDLSRIWGKPPFESDDDFITVAAARWNKSPITIQRYLDIWKWVIHKPKHKRARLRTLFTKPLHALKQVVGMCKAGEMTEEIWQRVELAVNTSQMAEIRMDVRGLVSSSTTALKLMMEKDGTIKARRGEGVYHIVGRLNVHLEEENNIIAAAIERIFTKSGMFRR